MANSGTGLRRGIQIPWGGCCRCDPAAGRYPFPHLGCNRLRRKFTPLDCCHERADSIQDPPRFANAVQRRQSFDLYRRAQITRARGPADIIDQHDQKQHGRKNQPDQDGYFVLPATVPDYLATAKLEPVDVSNPAFATVKDDVGRRIEKLLSINGTRSPDSFHKELGKLMWDECGMARSEAGLRKAAARVPELREEFWHNLRIVGGGEELNQSLEKANRISDFLELAELMCIDALDRAESCGGHFRVESQTPEGEAKRDDANFSHSSAWEWKGLDQPPTIHKEPLTFEYVHLAQRSYK